MNLRNTHGLYGALCIAFLSTSVPAQDGGETLAQRVDRLEGEKQQLENKVDALARQVEQNQMGALIPALGESEYGMGPSASKVYNQEEGLSIGGYGESLYSSPRGGDNTWDALRAVLYFGYRFDEKWVFNSEIEIEHGSTSKEGSVSLEFGYLDYLASDALSLRGGLLLSPMGLINELHEPTTFLSAGRPQTEKRIIPTTWRENGIGVFGATEAIEYRAYVMNGLAGEDFSNKGLRGGRQKGSKAAAEDLAFVGRVDYVGRPGLTVGGSLYIGNSGQEMTGSADLGTTIMEAHADYKSGAWRARALIAMASVDDAAEFNMATKDKNLAEDMQGAYVELGYDLFADVFPHQDQSLTPFVRFESIDTQASMPTGFTADASQDQTIITVGVTYQPIDQVIFKLDFEDWEDNADVFNFLIGYVF